MWKHTEEAREKIRQSKLGNTFGRANKGKHHSEETRQKMRDVVRKKYVPRTEEHKQKLRVSNINTWSNFVLKKKHSEITKERIKNMDPEKRKRWFENIRQASYRPENRERARKIMIKLRSDPNWIAKSKQNQRLIDKNGEKNPFWNRKHTVETRKLVSKTKKESPNTPRGKDNKAFIDGKGSERRGDRLVFMQSLQYCLWREEVFNRDNYTCQSCGSKHGGKLHAHHLKSYKEYPELRVNTKNGITLCFDCHKKTDNYGRKTRKPTLLA